MSGSGYDAVVDVDDEVSLGRRGKDLGASPALREHDLSQGASIIPCRD